MDRTKLMKTSGVMDQVCRVAQIMTVAGGVIILGIAVAALALGDVLLQDGAEFSLELGSFSLSLDPLSQAVDLPALRSSWIVTLAAAAVLLAAGWYGMGLFRRLLRPMKEGRPFDGGASRTIRRLAWVFLIGGAVHEALRFTAVSLQVMAVDLTALFDLEAVTHCTVNYRLDLGFLLPAIVLFLLAHIFRYGEELQRESDETL